MRRRLWCCGFAGDSSLPMSTTTTTTTTAMRRFRGWAEMGFALSRRRIAVEFALCTRRIRCDDDDGALWIENVHAATVAVVASRSNRLVYMLCVSLVSSSSVGAR